MIQVKSPNTGEILNIEGELLNLVEGVNYIENVYYDQKGFTQDNILKAVFKVLEIERLRGIWDGTYNVDSFIRENVFDIISREMENA